jgi:insertion element IS1 protein InsB
LELDERWHDLTYKRRTLWIWKALDRDSGQRLDGECGRRDKATLKQLVDRLVPWDVTVYGTDQWATYASVIPQDTLVQSHATTREIERHRGRQRHGFGRFTRKSMMVSQSKARVDLTMARFATVWVHGHHHGHQDELLSRLG